MSPLTKHLSVSGIHEDRISGCCEVDVESKTATLSANCNSRILIVDDESINFKVVQRYLKIDGYNEITGITDPFTVESYLVQNESDLVLLDLKMPEKDGIEVLKEIKSHPLLEHIPVVILTATTDPELTRQAFEAGATDFLRKPFDPVELTSRINNVLTAQAYRNHLKDYAHQLEVAVKAKTKELEDSRRDIVRCLAKASEFRDNITGNHIIRVGRYAHLIAVELELGDDFCETIELAAQLHDVGKIGITDSILRKPGKLSEEEFNQMKRHALMGKDIISLSLGNIQRNDELDATTSSAPDLLMMAERIAISHHEWFDGSGYPLGLKGSEIPLEGRITAVADVFDALTTARPYKDAYSLEKAFQIMQSESGTHFDPHVLDIFIQNASDVRSIMVEFCDTQL